MTRRLQLDVDGQAKRTAQVVCALEDGYVKQVSPLLTAYLWVRVKVSFKKLCGDGGGETYSHDDALCASGRRISVFSCARQVRPHVVTNLQKACGTRNVILAILVKMHAGPCRHHHVSCTSGIC